MAKLSLTVGVILVVIGVGGYVASSYASATALIPAAIGVLIGLLGLMARNDQWRRHAMHAAMGIALVGIFGTFAGLVTVLAAIAGNTLGAAGLAPMSKALTATVLIGYLAMGVRSFVHARGAERRIRGDRRAGPNDRRSGEDRRFMN